MIHPVMVVPREDGTYEITWLKKDAKDKDTYFESIIRSAHPMFNVITERISMLTMAHSDTADDTEVPGIGIAFRNTSAVNGILFAVALSDKEHELLWKEN